MNHLKKVIGRYSENSRRPYRKSAGRLEKIKMTISSACLSVSVAANEDAYGGRFCQKSDGELSQHSELNRRIEKWISESRTASLQSNATTEETTIDPKGLSLDPNQHKSQETKDCTCETLYHPDFADWNTIFKAEEPCEDYRLEAVIDTLDDIHDQLSQFFDQSLKSIIR